MLKVCLQVIAALLLEPECRELFSRTLHVLAEGGRPIRHTSWLKVHQLLQFQAPGNQLLAHAADLFVSCPATTIILHQAF